MTEGMIVLVFPCGLVWCLSLFRCTGEMYYYNNRMIVPLNIQMNCKDYHIIAGRIRAIREFMKPPEQMNRRSVGYAHWKEQDVP